MTLLENNWPIVKLLFSIQIFVGFFIFCPLNLLGYQLSESSSRDKRLKTILADSLHNSNPTNNNNLSIPENSTINSSKEQNKSDSSENKTVYTLNPEEEFFGFSTGANFAFVDGLDETSLFLDLSANVGQLFDESITAQFGVLSGRFSPNEFKTFERSSITINPESKLDSSTLLNVVNYDLTEVTKIEKKFTRAFVQLNYRIPLGEGDDKAKIFITLQYSYNRLNFNVKTSQKRVLIDTAQVSYSLIQSPLLSRRNFPTRLPPLDSFDTKVTLDRSSAHFGFKLFKPHKNFDFTLSWTVGITLIKSLQTGILGSLSNQRYLDRIETEDSMSYLLQGSILEKKNIGAKIGFELRSRLNSPKDGGAADYFFFISKQFSLEEFFKVFSP